MERVLFRRMNFVVYISFFHRFWIVMVSCLLALNTFCSQDHFTYTDRSHLLTLVYKEKHNFKHAGIFSVALSCYMLPLKFAAFLMVIQTEN